ncbi:MAG: deoxyribonuclease IV [Actinomycetia bacterium]|nr:deoxyribonuclease IV [Actinomycetes bacterium]
MLIGAHVSSSGGIDTAVDRIEKLRCRAVQIFTQSPRAWRPTSHSAEALERFRTRRREAGIESVVCHAIYLINLASPDRALYRKSVTALEQTVDVAVAIAADAVILHVGSHLGAGLAAALDRVTAALRAGLDRCSGPTHILLENSAGAGGTIGRSIEELDTIDAALDRPKRLGLCLDSCHLWVSGTDVTNPAVMDELLAEVERRFGLERLRCLHVNDASAERGSNRDRHANLLGGHMGAGLGAFLAHPALQHLPAILETPGAARRGPDADEVRKLRDLHAAAAGDTRLAK